MHLSVRKYKADPAVADEVTRRVNEGLRPIIRAIPGFISYDTFHDGKGTMGSVSFFEEPGQAEEATRVAADWVSANLSDITLTPPDVFEAEIGPAKKKSK